MRAPGLHGGAPRFAGVAFAIEWVPAWFYPYYFLLALAVLPRHQWFVISLRPNRCQNSSVAFASRTVGDIR